MSVRKREWITKDRETGEDVTHHAFVCDYTDQDGVRRLKSFKTKKLANDFAANTRIEVREGTHVPESDSETVADACKHWLVAAANAELEPSTLRQYRQHCELHIKPLIGRTSLAKINAPFVRAFEDRLRKSGCSTTMIRYVVRSLGAMLADAQERGKVARNAVRDLGRSRRGKRKQGDRDTKPKVGVDIPTREEISAIIHAADRHWRPLILTAIFTGLRASELRGLKWRDLDLDGGWLHIRQRADFQNRIGKLKTKAAARSVPLTPMLIPTLREWQRQCPKSKLDLVFPNGDGNVEFHSNIVHRGLQPILIKAGVTVPVLDDAGKLAIDKDGTPMVAAKYTGLHALRHFYASWCINRESDGGLELPPKTVQTRMGHSSITVTLDRYSHLFPTSDDSARLRKAERELFKLHRVA